MSVGLRRYVPIAGLIVAAPIVIALAGCGTAGVAANSANAAFTVSPGEAKIDTNCIGCNATSHQGLPVLRFSATQASGSAALVTWSVSGGDAVAGPGHIDASGEYTPPSYLTADGVEVVVTARQARDAGATASARIAVTPGFLQALTPQNAALGASGSVTVTGKLALAGGSAGIRFALTGSSSGAEGGEGSLSPTVCQRSKKTFTSCTVTYTAPAAIAGTGSAFLVASPTNSPARTEAEILLNSAGVTSNPADHQEPLATLMQLGSSGGNNNDFDARGNTIVDCCSGTLGALIQDASGRQYLLSNNHVLARSDHAAVGDSIVQPGLIDNNCTPSGEGPGTVPVGALTTWLPLKSPQTNADAAIAQVASRTVDANGAILELGARQADGRLAPAPPGISSSGGKGETAGLQMKVAKSGRTTGLTCGSISVVNMDVSVDYYRDCAETRPYLTKLFINQVGMSGDRFSDAGDSGALVVDANNAEPVGLFFAGGTDASGVGQGVANPAADVLRELGAQMGGGASFSFVGGADHGVSCLNYGNNTTASAQAAPLSDEQIERAQQSLGAARQLINPANGILGVAMAKSSDHPGTAAVIVYVDEAGNATVPATLEGVRTLVIPTNAHAVAFGTAPLANAAASAPPLTATVLSQALNAKRQVARTLMAQNPAFFGVGVGQSLDNPREAALVIFVDRTRIPHSLPETTAGLRTRYVIMDRLHVTRSYATTVQSSRHCFPRAAQSEEFDPAKPLDLNLP